MLYIVEKEEVLDRIVIFTNILKIPTAAVPMESGIALEKPGDVRGKKKKGAFQKLRNSVTKKTGLPGR